MKIIFIFSCSGMFRNVPCSRFYRRPTSVQYNSGVQTDCLYNECIRKRCSFQRKIFTSEVASFSLFQSRLFDSAGLALKRKVSLTYAQTRVWLQRVEIVRRLIVSARLELRKVYFRVLFGFYRCIAVSIFFVYTDMFSFEIIINSGRI